MADLNLIVVDMDDVESILRRCYTSRVTPFLQSEPGVGKTTTVRKIDRDDGAETVEFIGSQHDSVDMTGMPYIRRFKPDGAVDEIPLTAFARPDFWPLSGRGTFFLDDLGNADRRVQVACMQLALERKIGGAALPPDYRVVIASNTTAHASYVTPPPASFKNRVVTVRVKTSLRGRGTVIQPKGWLAWANNAGIHPTITAFQAWTNGELLCKFSPTADSFPSPRAWEILSKLVSTDPFPDTHDELPVLAEGTVGPEASAKYCGFVRLFQNLPDIHGIFDGTITESKGIDAQIAFAVMSVLTKHISTGGRKPSEISNALNWARKSMPEEILAALVAMLGAAWKPILGNPTFQSLFQKLSSFKV